MIRLLVFSVVFFFCLLLHAQKEEMRVLTYPDGTKQHEGRVVDGKQEGVHLWWHSNGKLMLEAGYSKGEPHGVWKRYDEEGNFVSEESFVHGKREGRYIFVQEAFDTNEDPIYDSLGNIVNTKIFRKHEYYYVNNIMQGAYKSYYTNGSLWESGNYENGLATGIWHEYDQAGRVKKITDWREGKTYSRRFFQYHANGKMQSDVFYLLNHREELPHGTWKQWYANGKKKAISNYAGGIPHGEWKSWHENGKRKFKAVYQQNALVPGSWKDYNERGKRIKHAD